MNVRQTLNQASPYILFGGGIVSLIGAVGTAIHATTKLGYVLDEYDQEKLEIAEIYEKESKTEEIGPDKALDIRKRAEKHNDLVCIGKVARLYWPTFALTGLSIGCFTGSVGILRGRYLAAQTALTGVTAAFDRYREGVREQYGEDKDHELYYGQKKEKIEVADPETGKKTKKELYSGKPTGMYTYEWTRFDPKTGHGSTQWDASPTLGHNQIVGVIRENQRLLDMWYANGEMDKRIRADRLLDQLGFENTGYAEAIAGYIPGDKIICGLEPEATMSEDAYNFCVGISNEVTLCFNFRPDIFGITCRDMVEQDTATEKFVESEVVDNE